MPPPRHSILISEVAPRVCCLFRRVAGAPDVGHSAITQKVTENSAQGVGGVRFVLPCEGLSVTSALENIVLLMLAPLICPRRLYKLLVHVNVFVSCNNTDTRCGAPCCSPTLHSHFLVVPYIVTVSFQIQNLAGFNWLLPAHHTIEGMSMLMVSSLASFLPVLALLVSHFKPLAADANDSIRESKGRYR